MYNIFYLKTNWLICLVVRTEGFNPSSIGSNPVSTFFYYFFFININYLKNKSFFSYFLDITINISINNEMFFFSLKFNYLITKFSKHISFY